MLLFDLVFLVAFIVTQSTNPTQSTTHAKKLPLSFDDIYTAQSLRSLIDSLRNFAPTLAQLAQSDSFEFENHASNLYALIFERAHIICPMQHNQANTRLDLITLTNIVLTQITHFQITAIGVYAASWNQFSFIYFQFFADAYDDYLLFLHQRNPIITIQTFHTIFNGLKQNVQNLNHEQMERIMLHMIKTMIHQHIIIDITLYIQIMTIFAKTVNFYGATTVMVYLEERTTFCNNSELLQNYKKSFGDADESDFDAIIQRLNHSPKTLTYVVCNVIQNHNSYNYGTALITDSLLQTNATFAHKLMLICAFHQNFECAVEILLNQNASILDLNDILWYTYLNMLTHVSNTTALDPILSSFKDLHYTTCTQRNNNMDVVIFFTFHYVVRYTLQNIQMPEIPTYEILLDLCDRSKEYNNNFLIDLFNNDYQHREWHERRDVLQTSRNQPGKFTFNADIEPTWKILKRLIDVKISKRSVAGYKNYIASVKKEDRDPQNSEHPVTPNARKIMGKRRWDSLRRNWTRDIHRWD